MGYFVGLIIAVLGIALSVYELKQEPGMYYDVVALAVVVGGTAAVAAMILPWRNWRDVLRAFQSTFEGNGSILKEVADSGFQFLSKRKEGVRYQPGYKALSKSKRVPVPLLILEEGAELIELGLKQHSIERVLVDRMEKIFERRNGVAGAIKNLAKYPPAFGLVGTVLGLVSLMRAISDGSGAQETGIRMAVALVATLYGLIMANLIVNPFGERIARAASEERMACDYAIHIILLGCEGVSLVEAQEAINAWLPPWERTDWLGTSGGVAGGTPAAAEGDNARQAA
jgi:chemotaxis protein MotA